MKQPLNEQFRRMQKLAGIIIQEAVNSDQLEVYAKEGQVDTEATFVTISSKGNVAKYDNFPQLVQGLQKMPRLALESAENDLTDGDIANAKELFPIAKAQLDGTKNYKLIARASERDDLDNDASERDDLDNDASERDDLDNDASERDDLDKELYIWGTMLDK